MATNPTIKKALLAKLNVSDTRLSQLVKARKREVPMTTEHAVYTIAHDNAIDISKHLDAAELATVRGLIAAVTASRPQAKLDGSSPRPAKRASPKPVVIVIAGVKVEALPWMSAAHAREAKLMAEKVYPTLYVFENSVRDLIARVLSAEFGADWWKKVPPKVRQTADNHMKKEADDPWHSARGRREIDYIFLNELWAIIKHHWSLFKELLPSQAWAESLITSDMNVSRRVLAHMNPLGDEDVKNIEAAFRKWVRQLSAKADLIPK